ncbi:MAG: nuclear transport factor 2 family protein [Saprospiraceae bacterium]|nr:nuclear transport factor 2 family protein [Saprospiraceae bacterium]
MKNPLLFIALTALTLAFSSCQEAEKPAVPPPPPAPEPAKIDLAQVRTDIQALENTWAEALAAKDIEKLMAFYADNAVSLPNDEPILIGKEAIRKSQEAQWAKSKDKRTYKFDVLDVFAEGNMVVEVGKSTYSNEKGEVIGNGKYMVLYEKRDGKYMVVRETYNNDMPAKK